MNLRDRYPEFTKKITREFSKMKSIIFWQIQEDHSSALNHRSTAQSAWAVLVLERLFHQRNLFFQNMNYAF